MAALRLILFELMVDTYLRNPIRKTTWLKDFRTEKMKWGGSVSESNRNSKGFVIIEAA